LWEAQSTPTLIPFYFYFKVHRNWLAITHTLPLHEWYTESTSEWTLDYPPFFAWFECALAKIASLLNIDRDMLRVNMLEHKSFNTVLFQRCSVIVTDLTLALGVKACSSALSQKPNSDLLVFLPGMVLSNAGLFIVDHVHFQYNGFLLGILLASIGSMMMEKFLLSALLFSILLNLKHIYLYCAPAYFVYLLTSYCRNKNNFMGFAITRLISLGIIVVGTFATSFGPFVMKDQTMVVLQRLFPFKRGLTHAYWAPNFWAVYNAFDRLAIFGLRALGASQIVENCEPSLGASTSGLVKDTVHCFLPSVPPIATFILTVGAQVPLMWKLWKSPNDPLQFLRAVVLCNFASFIFGWYVPN
jgi:alpha-1,3-glucosyltransferase